jgi:nucleoside 2-deoxyribosyltransferase
LTSYGNRGAYWEAGFAHGLGKPVFYLCDGGRFRRAGTHFDTNHHFTILWDANNMAKAGQELKTAIRFALPGDAKLTD